MDDFKSEFYSMTVKCWGQRGCGWQGSGMVIKCKVNYFSLNLCVNWCSSLTVALTSARSHNSVQIFVSKLFAQCEAYCN